MERLTFEGNFCEIARCKEVKCPYDTACSQKQIWERLKAYEDTGLSPEKVSWMKEVVEAAFDNDTSRIERAHNLHVADKEGRVIVLPCKVGDTIWRLKRTFETYPDKSKPYTEADGFLLQDIWNVGKNVFLTREEAEKALAEMEGKKDE